MIDSLEKEFHTH